MVQLIVGVKGEGKTKKMLEHVHNILASTDGNVVYLDKSTQNMHELDNRVRLINVTEYPIQNTDQFIGFVCGICSIVYSSPSFSKTDRRSRRLAYRWKVRIFLPHFLS